MFAAPLDAFQPMENFAVQIPPLEYLGVTQDRVQRRPQFMAHPGQERTLCLVRHFGPFLGHDQFGRSGPDQLFQMIAVPPQHLFGQLAHGNVFVGSQDADDMTFSITQWQLAGRQPGWRAIRLDLGFFIIEFGHTGFHYLSIIVAIEVHRSEGRHIVIIFANDFARIRVATVLGQRFVAPQVN